MPVPDYWEFQATLSEPRTTRERERDGGRTSLLIAFCVDGLFSLELCVTDGFDTDLVPYLVGVVRKGVAFGAGVSAKERYPKEHWTSFIYVPVGDEDQKNEAFISLGETDIV